MGKDVRTSASDLPDVLSEIFSLKGLDRGGAKQPDGQISCARNDCHYDAAAARARSFGAVITNPSYPLAATLSQIWR